ncbi:hypothetical protein E2986_03364 [Frieseomelitta varia]|uniref:Protein I'm not dead yet n=1 Tax=Frieseomelitta varia TaxID=561572 RepID=A0A833VKL2_9HYME|nr:hypothetical protein E2986_03364 [Frieseomelitta varia]
MVVQMVTILIDQTWKRNDTEIRRNSTIAQGRESVSRVPGRDRVEEGIQHNECITNDIREQFMNCRLIKNKNRRIWQIVDTISLNLLEIVRDYTMAADFVTYRRRRYYRGLYQQKHLVLVRAMRCLYVVGLMAMFWMTEVLPLPITGLIPVVLYPLMGIMNTVDTCTCYMNDTTMMFIGSMVIAIVIENSGLHMRIALLIIKMIGCSHRRLTLGLFCVTMFLSMWISNTAATTMMLPIVETVLLELEAQGLGNMFDQEENSCGEEGTEPTKKPTHTTMVYYLVTAYASSLGGIGTLVGTGTNLTLKGFFEKRFPNSSGISLASWMLYSVPPMLLMGFLTWLWLQVMYMGMFRPDSKDARAINIGLQGEKVAATVVEKKYKELGPITWHESVVGILFFTVVLLWFFRNPGFTEGWPSYLTNL